MFLRSIVLGALVALPFALTTPAVAAEKSHVRVKRSPAAGLAWKGQRHDARSRVKAQVLAAERQHQKRIHRMMKKRTSSNRAEIDRAIFAERRRHASRMHNLEKKYRLMVFASSLRGSERETKRVWNQRRKKLRTHRGHASVRSHHDANKRHRGR